MSTGYVWHEEFMWHDTTHVSQMGWYPAGIRRQFGQYNQPWQHYENAETKRRMHNLLAVTGLMEHLTPVAPIRASVEQLQAIHTPAYIERIQVLSDTPGGGDAGEAAPVGVGSYDIARLAAGGAIAAVEAVVSGKVQNAYALVRPPGHHAERDIGRGFCIFNNIAIAAAHARKSLGIQRVAIVDWDGIVVFQYQCLITPTL
jgi:acetoin utilization deacetylase AcuC-like enzyme